MSGPLWRDPEQALDLAGGCPGLDLLAEYAEVTLGKAPESGEAAGWGGVVRRLVALSRESDLAQTILPRPPASEGRLQELDGDRRCDGCNA